MANLLSSKAYAAFPHTADWALVTGNGTPQLGGYFRTTDDAVGALNKAATRAGWFKISSSSGKNSQRGSIRSNLAGA